MAYNNEEYQLLLKKKAAIERSRLVTRQKQLDVEAKEAGEKARHVSIFPEVGVEAGGTSAGDIALSTLQGTGKDRRGGNGRGLSRGGHTPWAQGGPQDPERTPCKG